MRPTRVCLLTAAALVITGCSGTPTTVHSTSPMPATLTGTWPATVPTDPATTPPSSAATSSTGPSVPSAAQTAAVGRVDTIATDLATPWGLAFLPNGSALLTERDSGQVKRIGADGTVTPVGTVDGVDPGGEGGLLGIAVDTAGTVFLYFTAAEDNRVATARITDGKLTDQRPLLTGIPKAGNHNGGRLALGPDGFLYIGTGDAGDRSHAQDLQSLGGKILRIGTDGKGAPGNPFPQAPLVFSYGHRNVQGLAFDDRGRLWASEFGQNTWDELNLIAAGGNYGWPDAEGPSTDPKFVAPQRTWPTDQASPSGIAVAAGSVWMAGLRGERLWQIPLVADGTGEPIAHFTEQYGRLRTVVAAPAGGLWLTTSNTDGRGDVRDGDDRILKIAVG